MFNQSTLKTSPLQRTHRRSSPKTPFRLVIFFSSALDVSEEKRLLEKGKFRECSVFSELKYSETS